jgi:hypothetical protein
MQTSDCQAADNPFAAFSGILRCFPGGVDEVNAWIRELRDEPGVNHLTPWADSDFL